MKTLDTESLRLKIENDTDLKLINVLPEEHFRKRHIPESVNIPLESERFEDQVGRFVGDKQEEFVVYCASPECDASPKAARRLEEAGFSNVFDYEGGTRAW